MENLAADFARVPYARYAPLRRQLLTILRTVNDARARTGYELVPYSALKLHRHVVRPFEPENCTGGVPAVPIAREPWVRHEPGTRRREGIGEGMPAVRPE